MTETHEVIGADIVRSEMSIEMVPKVVVELGFDGGEEDCNPVREESSIDKGFI